jgi:hypothetical protein
VTVDELIKWLLGSDMYNEGMGGLMTMSAVCIVTTAKFWNSTSEDAYTVIFRSTITPVRPHSLWTNILHAGIVGTPTEMKFSQTLTGDVIRYPMSITII